MCFLWGIHAGVLHGASQQKLVKCDMNMMSRGFGVEDKEGPISQTLLLVMHTRGRGHKGNFTMDKQVAV
jgi:hypothetical protein